MNSGRSSASVASYLATYTTESQEILRHLPLARVEAAIQLLIRALENDRFIYTMGNGGSAATASHLANDLGKGGMRGFPRRFKILSLVDTVPLLTAWANDTNYERVFVEQLDNFVGPGDVVIAISGSGNSRNVLLAAELGRKRGAAVVGLTGFDGGELARICDVCVIVPSDDMQHIEDMHLKVAHMIYASIRDIYMPKFGAV